MVERHVQRVIPVPPPRDQESERRGPVPGIFGKPRGNCSDRLSTTSKDWRGMAKCTNVRLDHEVRHERPAPRTGEPEHHAAPARLDHANTMCATNLFVTARCPPSSGCHTVPTSWGPDMECRRVASHVVRELRQSGLESHAACQFENMPWPQGNRRQARLFSSGVFVRMAIGYCTMTVR